MLLLFNGWFVVVVYVAVVVVVTVTFPFLSSPPDIVVGVIVTKSNRHNTQIVT